jgi:aminotransferase
MLCSPSNPTGAVIPPETLAAIGQFAYERGIWVLVDEIYYELVYDVPVQSFLSTYPNAKTNTIYVGGVSKNYAMTGWRIGYLCGPKAFIERALKIHQYTVMCVPTVGQYAALEAIRNHAGSVASMRADYDQRRRLFVAGLNDLGLPTAMPEGALYCFVDIRSTGLSSEAFAVQLLETQRVAVVPGSVFGQGGEGYVRCCYAVAMADLKTALTRIETFLNSR